jgi:uncharacterized protein YeaO (DUF488 family)
MALRVVRLGTPREPEEGLRIGTVRRPPRGVPREEFAQRDYYDVWLPELAPSQELVSKAQRSQTVKEWAQFVQGYRRQMGGPEQRHLIALLAAMSHHADLSVGCYCEQESQCHRSVLQELLAQAGAEFA